MDVSKYPFSKEAAELIQEEGYNIEDLAFHPDLAKARERALRRLFSSIEGRVDITLDEVKPMNDVYSFLISRIIVERIGDRFLRNRFAEHEAKRFLKLSEGEYLENLVKLAEESFEIKVKMMERKTVAIPYDKYLELARGLGGEKWRLVNRDVRSGEVIVLDREFRRLLAEAMRIRILKPSEIKEELPKPLEDLVSEVRRVLEAKKESLPKRKVVDRIAPCMKELLRKVSEGENLPHAARFALAAYLLKIGWEKRKVTDVFRSIPDFKEKIAAYQVEQIARRGYLPPSCSRLKSLGICVEKCGINNPLNYGRRKKNELGTNKRGI